MPLDTSDTSLFDDEPPTARECGPAAALPAWQVDGLRAALDRVGVTSMDGRQTLVEQVIGRPVDALRNLLPHEAGKLRDELQRRAGQQAAEPTGSRWDDREEDTWIDRM